MLSKFLDRYLHWGLLALLVVCVAALFASGRVQAQNLSFQAATGEIVELQVKCRHLPNVTNDDCQLKWARAYDAKGVELWRSRKDSTWSIINNSGFNVSKVGNIFYGEGRTAFGWTVYDGASSNDLVVTMEPKRQGQRRPSLRDYVSVRLNGETIINRRIVKNSLGIDYMNMFRHGAPIAKCTHLDFTGDVPVCVDPPS